MNSFAKQYYLILFIIAIFCLPGRVHADDLDQPVQNIIEKFEQQLDNTASGQAIFLAVRTFFDEVTQTPSLRSEEIRNKIFNIISDKYKGTSKIAILNWRSERPLEKEISSAADGTIYKQDMLLKQLLEDFGRGFLVGGTTRITEKAAVIHIELINAKSGKVLMRSKAAMPLSDEEAMLAKKTAVSEPMGPRVTLSDSQRSLPGQTAAKKAADDLQSVPTKGVVSEKVVSPDKRQKSEKVAAVDAAEAVKPEPSESKAVPETVQEDLEYRVIEGDNFKYEGQVKDGLRHGQGILTFKSGDKYEGAWRNDKKDGQGTYAYADGDKYVGQWKDDKMEGQGTYFFKSGNKYVGQWHNDKKHGHGVYYFKNGDRWEGTYVNDKKNGYSIYTWASGGSSKEYWKDGKLVE